MARIEFGYRPDLLTRKLSGVLDHCRWIAALAVCCAHLRNLLLPDFVDGNLYTKIFYFITLFGTQAVVVFFVTSGILVGGSIIRSIDRGHFDKLGYAIDRASRLYVVLIPAIILSEALRLVNLARTCSQHHGLNVLVANFLLLQNFISAPLCNNHPLWSLSSEAFFYLIGPALILALLRRMLNAMILSVFLILICAFFWSDSYMTPTFGLVLWSIGLAPWFIRVRCPNWIGIIPFVAVLILSRSHNLRNEFLENIGIAFTFMFFLCCNFAESEVRLNRLGSWLASFSYSLYLIHMPIAQAITSCIDIPLPPSSLWSYIIYIAALALIVGIAWLFGRLFEDHTKPVRNWLRRHCRVGPPLGTKRPSLMA